MKKSGTVLPLFLILLLYLMCRMPLTAQDVKEIRVMDEEGQMLSYPWAGGLNSVQFGSIDINRNGLKDLFVFDRHGNRKLCFVNNGVYNKISFTYSPEYTDLFPELYDWAIFADYDADGRTDIFTYSPGWGGMKVYRNVSEDLLKFELVVDPYLTSLQGDMYLNLLVTDVDYPGIADVDNDGDLDILAFWGLGSFVNYHRNMSMEKYGNADSLDFVLEDYCWGSFAESDESNKLYLDTCVDRSLTVGEGKLQTRHTGSTFLLHDLDKDTIVDLLLGDVDYPGLFALMNNGTKYNAHIYTYDTLFPSSSQKISLYSFPVAAYIDVNNDNKKDLLVSSFDPRPDVAENKKSVWYYKNTGTDNKPFFVRESTSFLQDEMIDAGAGASPVLYDWDKDGLLDLFIGNFGVFDSAYYDDHVLKVHYKSGISYYRNTGTATTPAFQLYDEDFGGLLSLGKKGIKPAFGDLDGDGETDILTGCENGKLIRVSNNGETFEIVDTNYLSIDVGDYSAPQFFDLDRDGLNDLIIGEQSGNLNYYRNTGTQENPVFEFVTDSLGKVRVTDIPNPFYGYSVPWFFRGDDDTTRLVVGSEEGLIYYFTNIDGNLDGEFTLSQDLGQLLDTSGVSFDRGSRTAAAIADIAKDGKPEMIAGNFSGGLEYFNGFAEVSPGFAEGKIQSTEKLNIYPNPASHFIEFRLPASAGIVRKCELIPTFSSTVNISPGITNSGATYRIGIDFLAEGVYLLRVITDNVNYTGKFVKVYNHN